MNKADLRKQMSAARGAISVQQQVSEAASLIKAVRDPSFIARPCTIAGYVPFGAEPGSLSLLDVLREAGNTVLLPVIPAEVGPLDWAEYAGTAELSAGRFRQVLEPTTARLGPAAIAEADKVLVPALSVDRHGVRLGKGAGYYDRSLALATSECELIALIRMSELVPELPADQHDVPMTALLTPESGKVALPLAETDFDRV